MKSFGFLSFGHFSSRNTAGPDARAVLKQALELSQKADEIGVNGAYFRVHHFERQGASPMPLLGAIAGSTKHIEVGTGVIDMRYENPFQLAEEVAALDLLSDQRIAIGVSRGSPESADRGWETFGYTGSKDPRGADIARAKFDTFQQAIAGVPLAPADPAMYGPGVKLPVQPNSPDVNQRIWWGAGTRETAEWAAAKGTNLMSSTLLTEATGESFASLQKEQIDRYRAAWKQAGHSWTPRVSVSRSVFPIVSARDAAIFGQLRGGQGSDQIGMIDGFKSTFGRTYVGSPDQLIDQLKADEAVMAADTLMLTIPNQMGVEINLGILKNFAEQVAPELGWVPANEGRAEGYPID